MSIEWQEPAPTPEVEGLRLYYVAKFSASCADSCLENLDECLTVDRLENAERHLVDALVAIRKLQGRAADEVIPNG